MDPFTISQGGGSCGPEQWAVLDADGNQVGTCFDNEADAQADADARNEQANADEAGGTEQLASDSATPPEWHAWVLPGDTPSTDGREFASEGGGWRDVPLPAMLMTANDWGHDGARFAGNALTMEWRDGLIYAEGTYARNADGTLTADGEEMRNLVETQQLRWVSADVMDVGDVELYELLPDGTEVPYEIPDMMWFSDRNRRSLHAEDAAEEESGRIVERYLSWRVGGLTVLPFPAFPQCVIAPIDVPLPDAAAAGEQAAEGLGMASRRSVVASAAFPAAPPADWFDDPGFGDPATDERLVHDPAQDLWACPLTVTSDGRIFGHLAPFEECHIGHPEACLSAPTSPTNYAYFRTGVVETAEGSQIAVGQITLQGGHPDLNLDYRQAQAHYDDTRSAVADVACGEDAYGVWVAGAVRPGVTAEQLRVLRASALSGDWRPVAGNLELVAALCVNVQGFPIPRRSAGMAASGRQLSLVAAGVRTMARLRRNEGWRSAVAELSRRLDALDVRTAPLMPAAAAALRDEARR